MINLLKDLQSCELLENHILAGGTSVALQLGHRISEDLDLFYSGKSDYDKIFNIRRDNE